MRSTASASMGAGIADMTTMIASSWVSGTTNIGKIFRPDLPIAIGYLQGWSANLN
ncbi:MAG: hypothetical protein NVS1B11_28620 [Terriglobales bacterium]